MTLRQVAFWAVCIGVPLGVASDGLYFAASHFPLDPAAMIKVDVLTADPVLLRWAAATDFGGFYLPLVPVALYLRARFAGRDQLLDLYTVAVLAFAAIGGAAALVLGTVGPVLATSDASGGPENVIAARALEDTVFVAIWQTFGAIAFGVFAIGIGRLLRHDHRSLGSLTIFIGADALVVAISRIAGLEPVAIVTIVIWLPLLSVWSAWLASSVLREDATELALAR